MNLKHMSFASPFELCLWVNDPENNVGAIQSSTVDPKTGQYVVFYTPATQTPTASESP